MAPRVKAGDPLRISADTWNRAEDFFGGGRFGGAQGFDPRTLQHLTPVRAVNASGNNIARWEVTAIAEMAIDPEDAESAAATTPVLKLEKPDYATNLCRLVIALQPIAANSVGWIALDGFTIANVNVINVDHGYAMLDSNELTQLRSADSGPFRLIKPSDVGVRRCSIDFHGNPLWRYKLTEDFDSSPAAARLINRDQSFFDGDDDTNTVEIHDFDPTMFADQVEGNVGYALLEGGRFTATQAPC